MAQEGTQLLSLSVVVANDYKPIGTYEDFGGLRTYTTGERSSERGVILVYDGFGICDQVLQGADRLAISLEGVVLVPDFFKGSGADRAWFPMDTDEKKIAAHTFMKEKANVEENYYALLDIATGAKQEWPHAKGWGVFGLGWGAKIAASFASGPESVFKASGQAYPSRSSFDKNDASKIAIPHICLDSGDGPEAAAQAYVTAFGAEGVIGEVEIFNKMHHGWMGAMAKLEDADIAEAYATGYKKAASFFRKYL